MGPPLKKEVKAVIFKVHSFFKKRKADTDSIEHKNDVNLAKLIAEATGVSERTVRKVVTEGRLSLESTGTAKFVSPRKPKEIKKKIPVDDYDFGMIRRKINEFYTVDKKFPSLRKLNEALKEDGILDCGVTFLRQLLYKLGYSFRKSKSKRLVLVERPHIVEWRVKYLRAIRKYRSENRNIFFLDETFVKHSPIEENCGNTESDKGSGLVIFHAGSRNGLVDGAMLILKHDSKTGNYQEALNSDNFMNWVNRKLKNKLPPNSVVVMDSAAHHCVQVAKKPTMLSLKPHMQHWLRERHIPFSSTMVKAELFGLINKTQIEKKYAIEDLLKAAGHTVLILPPFYPDLNPMELVWAEIKNNLIRNHIPTTLNNMITILTGLFSEFTAEAWQNYDDEVEKIEQEYWNHEMKIDSVMDEIVTNLNNNSDSDTMSSESSDIGEDMSE